MDRTAPLPCRLRWRSAGKVLRTGAVCGARRMTGGTAWIVGVTLIGVVGAGLPAGGAEWFPRQDWEEAVPEYGTDEAQRLIASLPPPPPPVPRFTVSAVLGSEIALGRLEEQFGVGASASIGLAVRYGLRRRKDLGWDLELALSQSSSGANGLRGDAGDIADDARFSTLALGMRLGMRQAARLRPFVGVAAIYRTGEVQTALDTVEITGYGGRVSTGVDFALDASERFILSAQLGYDVWHGRDENKGEGIESTIGLGVAIGMRF